MRALHPPNVVYVVVSGNYGPEYVSVTRRVAASRAGAVPRQTTIAKYVRAAAKPRKKAKLLFARGPWSAHVAWPKQGGGALPSLPKRAALARLVGVAETLTAEVAWSFNESWSVITWLAVDATLGLPRGSGIGSTRAAFIRDWGMP